MSYVQNRLFRNAVYAGSLLLASVACHAQSSCVIIDKNGLNASATPQSTIAVAANFDTAARSLVQSYILYANNNNVIRVCSGSSGALFNEITRTVPSPPPYSLFLSADKDRPDDLKKDHASLVSGNTFLYANGIPVFYTASTTYSASNYLLSGVASTESSAVADGLPNFVQVKIGVGSGYVAKLGVGSPTLAPYGAQAQSILNLMKQWTTSTIYDASGTSGSCTTQVGSGKGICTYADIGLTKTAIDAGDVDAGFISWGQVCALPSGSSKYVKFSAYPLPQYGILLTLNSDPTANSIAAGLVSYMNVTAPNTVGSSGVSWNAWLTGKCYGTI